MQKQLFKQKQTKPTFPETFLHIEIDCKMSEGWGRELWSSG